MIQDKVQIALNRAIALTNQSKLAVDDLVVCNEADKILKIMEINGNVATVSDKEKTYFILLTDLAYAEIWRVELLKETYGKDNLILVT